MNIKLPWVKLYFSDFLNGCRGLTHQQKGVYFTLFCLAGMENGRGLPNNFDELCLSVNIYDKNPEKVEELKHDLTFILNKKFVLIDNHYHNQRQFDDFNNEIQTIRNKSEAGRSSSRSKRSTEQKQKLNRVSESESISYFNYIWENIKHKRGSKQVALKNYLAKGFDVDKEKIIKKYNDLCSTITDTQYIPHFATWINQERWEEELSVKSDSKPIEKTYKDYVWMVKKQMRSTRISDNMVRQMKAENLITEEEFKAW